MDDDAAAAAEAALAAKKHLKELRRKKKEDEAAAAAGGPKTFESHSLDEKQYAYFVDVYGELDAAKKGSVDAATLRENLRGLDVKITAADAEGMVSLADSNGSGGVEWNEFLEMMDAFWGHPKPPRWQLWWTSWLEAARRKESEEPAKAPKRRGSVAKQLEPLRQPTRWGGAGARAHLDPAAVAAWKAVFDGVADKRETFGLRDLAKATKLGKAAASKLFKLLDATDAGGVSLVTFLDVVGARGPPPAKGAWWKPFASDLGESPQAAPRRRGSVKRRGSASLDSAPSDSDKSSLASPMASPELRGRSLEERPSLKRSPSLRRASRTVANAQLALSPSLSPPAPGKRSLPSLRRKSNAADAE